MATEFKPAEAVSVPLPLEKHEYKKSESSEYRIWIGNMDLQMNEFTLLQLLKKYEGLKSFDMLYHKAGPQQGQSKGFGFATYKSKQEAEKAIFGLNNRLVMRKRIQVRWANEQAFNEKPAPAVLTTSLEMEEKQISRRSKPESSIEAIERKLREMEQNSSSGGDNDKRRFGLHPLLQQARIKKEQEEARKKRLHPYKRGSRSRSHRR